MAAAAGLAGWIAAAALSADLRPVRAQESSPPPVEVRRADASFVPTLLSDRPLFVLAIGSDARPGVCMPVERCLADSLHLVGVDPGSGEATMLGFPRDSYVDIPGEGRERINEALRIGGPDLVVRTVERLTGISIDYYVLTSFPGLTSMVDDVGGVEVDVPYPMDDAASGATFDAGPHRMSGEEALAFARNRKDTPNADFSRSQNHGLLMRSALEELHGDFEEDPVALFRWIVTGVQNVETDLSFAEVFDLMVTALSVEPDGVTNCVVPGSYGFAGPASVVMISDAAEELYADMKADGVAAC